ncbi:MAG TPA: hypothetical protein VGN57_11935 [Pirellulaceae bacterium]|nr:hypothetical protein [Pirellulaceae bacterium]
MNLGQRLFQIVVPRSWRDSMEAESRRWMMQCPCGHEKSVWDAGGVRWKAKGEPRRRTLCPKCGVTWHRVYFKPDADQAETREKVVS